MLIVVVIVAQAPRAVRLHWDEDSEQPLLAGCLRIWRREKLENFDTRRLDRSNRESPSPAMGVPFDSVWPSRAAFPSQYPVAIKDFPRRLPRSQFIAHDVFPSELFHSLFVDFAFDRRRNHRHAIVVG